MEIQDYVIGLLIGLMMDHQKPNYLNLRKFILNFLLLVYKDLIFLLTSMITSVSSKLYPRFQQEILQSVQKDTTVNMEVLIAKTYKYEFKSKILTLLKHTLTFPNFKIHYFLFIHRFS